MLRALAPSLPPAAVWALAVLSGSGAACTQRSSTAPAAAATADPALSDAPQQTEPQITVEARVDLPGLAGLSCQDASCTVLIRDAESSRLHTLDPVTLALGEATELTWGERLVSGPSTTGSLLLGPCQDQRCLALPGQRPSPLPPAQDAALTPAQVAAAWNLARGHDGRSAFAARVPVPDGGVLAVLRSAAGARLMRSGAGVRMVDLPDTTGGPGYARALALHPTGREAYVIATPGSSLLAIDPVKLSQRWRIPLQPRAHGLFVDGEGRLLLLEEGAQVDPERLMDLGTRAPGLPDGASQGGDLALAVADRPHAATTAVVDLAVPRLVWREDGRYLGLQQVGPEAWLLATDQALVSLTVPPRP